MADKRAAKRGLKRLEAVKTWQLVIILILGMVLAATFLRINNVGMIERRESVKSADEQGDLQILHERLYELKRYSAQHMNANTEKFSLVHQYSRDSEAAINKVLKDNSLAESSKIEQTCKARTNSTYGQAWIQCFTDELAALGPAKDPFTATNRPNADAYSISYLSPVWSPDFAGFTVLFCILVALLIVSRIVAATVLRIILNRRYKSV